MVRPTMGHRRFQRRILNPGLLEFYGISEKSLHSILMLKGSPVNSCGLWKHAAKPFVLLGNAKAQKRRAPGPTPAATADNKQFGIVAIGMLSLYLPFRLWA